ncbi:MAG TPA: hypothetical protein VGX68_10500 [Thermoanaerobaculia bacterium]|jgi:hypothetical protein|nr:hypothetical protein [Thermoanaerobaculia bacterium]
MKTRTHRLTHRTARASLGITALLLCGAAEAAASDWQWSITPYAWATDVGVDVTLDDRKVLDKTIEFEDLLEDLDTAAQVHIEAQRGAHGVMFDLFDVQLSEDESRFPLPAAGGAEAVLSSEIGMTILELGGIYDPRGDQQGFELLYGTRILDQRAEIHARFELPAGTVSQRYEPGETLYDGLLGVRYIGHFSQRWSYLMRADVSAGGTELTWNGAAALAYAFGDSGRYSLTVGYRQMVVDFESDDSIGTEMTLSGFAAGLRVAF